MRAATSSEKYGLLIKSIAPSENPFSRESMSAAAVRKIIGIDSVRGSDFSNRQTA